MVKAPRLPGITTSVTNRHAVQAYVESLAAKLGAGPIERITITSTGSSGSYASAKISVTFSPESSQQIFFKDLSRPFRAKDDVLSRRNREVYVYENLLASADLGTARLIDVYRDESKGQCWLLLEYVDGIVIEDPGDELAVEAAGWLAHMQAEFLPDVDRLDGDRILIRHDAAFFLAPIEEATRNVAILSPGSSELFSSIVDRYTEVVELLSSQPRTLVHGGFIPWHVMVDSSSSHCRVIALDWELAATGSPLYDLAFFTDWASPEVKERLSRAYRTAAQARGIPTPDSDRRIHQVMNGFLLYRTLEWLSKSLEHKYSPEKVEQLLRRANALVASFGELGSI